LNLNSHFDGVFHGGPPCQPFSIAANQRFTKEDENFKRKGFSDEEKGNLLNDYIWFIIEFKPKVFMIENVPGLYEIDNGKGLSNALDKLTKVGYNIAPQIVNAANYGVPQKRLRLIVIGTREKQLFKFPQINFFPTSCQKVFEKPLEETENHLTREHTAQSVLRYMQLDYGQRDHLGRVDRLNPYLPSKTVIAGGTKGGGRSHLHPYSPCTLSVRECARLQTFPDNYIFTGSAARQFTQVGNAVPPLIRLRDSKSNTKAIFLVDGAEFRKTPVVL
jgi:DNA (cytosine-5)-methyltransferase 1